VTHLKAQQNEANELIRCKQVDELLESISLSVARLEHHGDKDVPVIVMGDFNADPPCETGESSIRKVLLHSFGGDRGRIRSAYAVDPPSDTFYTTWKTRGSKTTRRIIDYIFYSGALERQVSLQVPSETELEETKLPGLRHPSDHMLIAAKFHLE
jgi:endonuclease/exonuclease/phosphatase family metal-dependent hydrolase